MNKSGPKPNKLEPAAIQLPIEVEVYIDPDGSATFADLEAGMIPIARHLNPDEPLVCDVKPLDEEIPDHDGA